MAQKEIAITFKPATVIFSLLGIAVLIGGMVFVFGRGPQEQSIAVQNVSIVDGTQIVEIKAKGGYQPRKSTAKAGMKTVVRFDTNGTFDCSSSVRIPSLDISKSLPPSGSTDIALGTSKPGVLQGTCGMGMYPFEIDFQSS